MQTFVDIVRGVLGTPPSGGESMEYIFAGLCLVLCLVMSFKLLRVFISLFTK